MNAEQLKRHIIEPTLKKMGMYSESAVNLLLGTCAQESLMGQYVRQLGGGPAIGIYQMEPITADDIMYRYLPLHKDIEDKFLQAAMPYALAPKHHVINAMIFDVRLATALCRLKYWMDPEPLPEADDIEGLAKTYKRVYNTPLGAATTDEFVAHYRRYVK